MLDQLTVLFLVANDDGARIDLDDLAVNAKCLYEDAIAISKVRHDYGSIPHSNISCAIGAATLLNASVRNVLIKGLPSYADGWRESSEYEA